MKERVKSIVDELMKSAAMVPGNENDPGAHEKKMHRMARKEIQNFLLYLSASDGSIEEAEALFIEDYLGENITPDEMCQKIEDENIYSVAFEQRAPLMLKRLVKLDNMIFEKDGNLTLSQAEMYICLYEALGKEFIACDREPSQSEKDDLKTYITNMQSFYRANYKGPEEATEASRSRHAASMHAVRNQQRNTRNCREDREETLDDLLGELNTLVGLDKVKATVTQLIHYNQIRQIRDERGMAQLPVTQHMVFYGNPGTGKTTVARLIAKIYHHLGILSKGQLVEVDRSGLVAGYVGHTALKVKEVVKEAKGGVLFIDEAYSLTYKRSENDFGWEAVDTLIKVMEDEREDLVIIVAGYPEPMNQFINSNPGLKSRFNRFIEFEDYDGEQLLEIYQKMLQEAEYESSDDALEAAEEFFENKVLGKDDNGLNLGFNANPIKKKPLFAGKESFANARLVRNYLETAIMNQADRLYGTSPLPDGMLRTLEYEDVAGIA